MEAGKHTPRQVSSGTRALSRLGVAQISLAVKRDKLALTHTDFDKLVEQARTREQQISTRFLPK